jgi:putative transposase
VFTDEILSRCEDVMRQVCTDFDAELREFNGEGDHVHLLVHYPPQVALSRLVNSLKGVASRRLRVEYASHIRRYLWGGHLWSPSYFAGSCGGAPVSVVREYIENQKRPD